MRQLLARLRTIDLIPLMLHSHAQNMQYPQLHTGTRRPPNTFTNAPRSRVRMKHSAARGFTIVELLITIVVIAILAAVVVVAYNGVTKSARETQLKSDLKSASSELTRLYLKDRSYPDSADALKRSDGTTFSHYFTERDTFCLAASLTADPGMLFHITEEGNVASGRCTPVTTLLATGNGHTCAGASGAAYCWGLGNSGQLGNNAMSNSFRPVAVTATGVLVGKRVTAISAGTNFSCGIWDGDAYCWGNGTFGRLGNGDTNYRSTPTPVATSSVYGGEKRATAIAAGSNQACAIWDGNAYCWGLGTNGRLGNGDTNQSTPHPVYTGDVLEGRTVTAIATGGNHSCAIADGQAYCWGLGGNGQLGNASTSSRTTPVAVSTSGVLAGKTVTAITTGTDHTCVLADGHAYCWGGGTYGNLGDGTTMSRTTPVAVTTSGALAGKTVTAITAAGGRTCAVAGGHTYCWGIGVQGALGNGDTTDRLVPTLVENSSFENGKNQLVNTGTFHTCTTSAGNVYCWGRGSYGELGDDNATQTLTPVPVLAYP